MEVVETRRQRGSGVGGSCKDSAVKEEVVEVNKDLAGF